MTETMDGETGLPPRKWGKSGKCAPEIVREICARLADGETLVAICRREGMPAARTVRRWAQNDVDGFSSRYARARELQAHTLADLLLERAGREAGSYEDERGRVRVDPGQVNRDRLFCDNVKWYLARILPNVYGEKSAVDVTVRTDLAARIEEARERAQREQ